MRKSYPMLIVVALIGWMAAGPAVAQAPDQSKLGPVTVKRDRTTADPATRKQMQERQAALRLKRNACREQRRAQKIPFRKRSQFIRDCMAK